MGETLFNTFKFDFFNKQQPKEDEDDDDSFEKPKKSKVKKKPESTKTEEPQEVQKAKFEDSAIKYETLKARPSDLPDPNDPTMNFFSQNGNQSAFKTSNEYGAGDANGSKSSSNLTEKFKYNRRYMYDSTGDLVSYE